MSTPEPSMDSSSNTDNTPQPESWSAIVTRRSFSTRHFSPLTAPIVSELRMDISTFNAEISRANTQIANLQQHISRIQEDQVIIRSSTSYIA